MTAPCDQDDAPAAPIEAEPAAQQADQLDRAPAHPLDATWAAWIRAAIADQERKNPIDPALLEVIAKGADAMLQNQADMPPAIIHTLTVLLDRASYGPEHVKWVEDGARATLERWKHAENLEQLRQDLGVGAGKKPRRHTATVQRETAIAAAIVEAALKGASDPKEVALNELQADEHNARRAWDKWGPVYLARLALAASKAKPEDRTKIVAAIDALGSQNKNL